MRSRIFGATLIIISLFVCWYLVQQKPTIQPAPQTKRTTMTLNITSPAFKANEKIPVQFTCDGEGILPELIFTGIPEGTQSLALIMDDPDAPKGTFDHLVVWNIPSTSTGIKQGSNIPGEVGSNSSGKIGYVSPCPPDREHRYIFSLYAVDSVISLPSGSTKSELLQALDTHIIEQAQLTGLYNRK